jgi:hypothetical protein
MQWIKCSDRMPKEENDVLVFTKAGHIFQAVLLDEEHFIWEAVNLDMDDTEIGLEHPIYWMPLPKPPEEE